MPVIPALWRSRQVDHLRSGVRDQPGQNGETPCLLKIQKLAGCAGSKIMIKIFMMCSATASNHLLKDYKILWVHSKDVVLLLLPRLECNDAISAHHNLPLLCSSDSSASASRSKQIEPKYGEESLTTVKLVVVGKVLADIQLDTTIPNAQGLCVSLVHTLDSQDPIETKFHHIGQAVLELLNSGDLPASASQNAEITGVKYTLRKASIQKVQCKIMYQVPPEGTHVTERASFTNNQRILWLADEAELSLLGSSAIYGPDAKLQRVTANGLEFQN
ncbi:hypothetical protein AAY473_029274 [Plecturocebus cupreus]